MPTTRLRSHKCPKWFTFSIWHQIKYVCALLGRNADGLQLFTILKLLQEAFQKDLIIAKSDFELNLINSMAVFYSAEVYRHIKDIIYSFTLPATVFWNKTEAKSDPEKVN